jgi:hypothetical protein
MAAVDGHHPALTRCEVADRSDWNEVVHYFRAAGVNIVSRRSLPRR